MQLIVKAGRPDVKPEPADLLEEHEPEVRDQK